MIALSGADLVLPDRVITGGSIVIEHGRIAAIESRAIDARAGLLIVDVSNHVIAPGFVDVHVHGVEGVDLLNGVDVLKRQLELTDDQPFHLAGAHPAELEEYIDPRCV